MSATITQLIGGSFQDAEGNLLANGYLTFKLSQDGSVAGVGNICSGIELKIQLDSMGNVASSTSTPPASNQYLWANPNISPINTFYKVVGYTAEGQRAFGSNNQQVASGSVFNLDLWVPNTVISWFPQTTQPLLLEVNGTPNSSQQLLNLESTDSSVIITDLGNGNINFQSGASSFQNIIGCTAAALSANNFTQGANLGMSLTTPFNNSRQNSGSGAGASEGVFATYQTDSSSQTGSIQDQVQNITLGILKDWFAKISILGFTSSRYWNGITDSSTSNSGNVFFSDTPAANFVGFRFSTGAGDTHYKAICQTGSSNQTVVDTGVSPTVADKLEFKPSGSTVVFYINGITVATISTNIPATSVAMSTFLSNDCDGDIGLSNFLMAFYYVYAILNY